MVNHLIKQFFNQFTLNNTRILKTIPFINHNFSTRNNFDNVYSNENLERCLNDLSAFSYHNSTNEEKKKFFEIKKKDVKKAAVLIPFCYNEHKKPSILFTLRSPNLTIHKWEVCFPGGKLCELQDDGDICNTAVREVKEELGIPTESIDILGVLSPIAGKTSNSFIFPVLAKINLTKENDHNIEFLNKNLDEVEEVIIKPISELIKEENWSFTHWENGFTTPIYRDQIFDDKKIPRIWGLTGYLLFQVLSNLVPNYFKLKYFTLERYSKK